MKKLMLVVAAGTLVTACSTTAPVAQTPVKPSATSQVAQAPRLAAPPEWFIEPPISETAVYSVGDGTSSSYSGALSYARANAFEAICLAVGGKVRSQTTITRQDTEKSGTSSSVTAIRSMCQDVDVTGAHIVRKEFVHVGNRIKAFVLVEMPLGDANILARTKQEDKLQERAFEAGQRELKEMDKAAAQAPKAEIKLLDVDSEDYKARRDAALQKPGAVIGQITVQ